MRYEDASHTGAFQGQGPVANDDLEMVAAGSKSAATGNLITGDGTQSGSAGADSGAGAHITAIAGKSGEDTSFAGGKLSVEGDYGKLSVDAEGNYVYQANKGVENVRDRFTYTLADNQGATDTAALIVEIGKTPVVIKADAQQIVPGPDGVVTLPPGVELSDVHVVGRNLVIDMPDGTQLIIVDGAVFVPQLVINGVEIPATNVAALLVGQEIQPAAGELPPSSGGNFAVPPPPLDPGVPLGDLIPPTEYVYQPPEPQEVLDIEDSEPEAGVATALLDDDAQAGGNPLSNVGDDPGGSVANGNLPGSGGDGDLTWALPGSGTLPVGLGFSFSPQLNGDLWILQNGVHVLTVHVNPANGDYTVTQIAAIDHTAGGDENNAIFVIDYSVTDEDGDVATGTLTIDVDDDTPSVNVQAGADANVILTTDDAETIGAASDTAVTAANFSGVFSGTSVVFGADGAGPGSSSTYALAVTGQNSGLTSHGATINLFVVSGVVVGTTAASAGAINAGNTIFTVSTTNTGVVTLTQFQQIDHAAENPSGAPFNDQFTSMVDGLVTLTRSETAVDGDGDQVTGSATVNIGANLHFTDDGPSIDPTLNEVGAAIVDESAPVEANTIPLVGGFTAGDDPHLAGGLAIGKGSTSGAVVDANAVFGADGPANGGGISYDLVVLNAVSGLTTTEGVAINLVELSNGVVVGVVDGTTTVAFAIQIDSVTGVVTVEQYLSLFHLDSPNNFDEPVFLDEGSLGVTVTATDFDGDTATSDAVDITSLIRFEDDGPSVAPVLNADATVTVDESLPSNTPGIDTGGIAKGDDPDLAGGLAIGQSSSGVAIVDANAVFGADGPADSDSLSYSLDILSLDSGLTLTDGTPIDLQMVNGVIVGVVNGGTFDGQAAFAIAINSATGVVTVEQYLSLDHPINPNPNDPLSFGEDIIGVTVTATDGDGDQITSDAVDIGGQLTFLDDGPAANDDTDTVNNDTDTAVGNVITGSGTAEGTGNADVPGADGFGAITGLVSDGTDDSDTDPSGGFTVTGLYGTLEMDADGNYTYTRDPASPGNVSESFTYTYVDGDGDPVEAVLTININDETPTLPDPDLIRLDDDVIPGANGNPNGPGDDDPDAPDDNVVNGQLNGSGGNGDLDYAFTGTNTLPLGLGFSIDPASDADTLIIVQDQNGSDVTVMTIELNLETGAFTVTQDNPIWHPADNGGPDDDIENNLLFSIGVEVVDADGDAEPATITINVDDDTPTATATMLTGTVDEDGVLEGAADNGPGDGIAGGTGDVAGQVVSATGNVSTLFSIGADGLGSYSLLSDFTALIAQGLTSNGVALSYNVGFAAGVYTLTATAPGGNTIFTFTLNATTGAYNFTLVDQLDHAAGNNENDLTINLSSIIQVTDADGDSIGAGANGLIITVDDDTPIATNVELTGTVDEDGVVEGAADAGPGDGIAGGVGDVAGQVVVASGSFTTLFQSGADEPLTYQLVNAVSLNSLGLTSGGVALTYQISFSAGVYTLTASAPGGNTIFTLTLDQSTGAYTFTLVDQLDHATGLDENDLAINLSSIIQATDRDGDTVAAGANALVITVDDDTPTLGTIQNGTASNTPGDPVTVGTLHFEVGADEPADVTSITTGSLAGITSGGKPLVVNFNNTTNVLTAYQDNGIIGTYEPGIDTVAVFTLTVDPNAGTSGQYTFDLLQALDPTITNVPIGGSSSFGAGPTLGQILEDAGGADLSVVSGYTTTAGFNFAAWFASGTLNGAIVDPAGVNGSTSGWGVEDNNFGNTDEIFFFDLGDEALSDPDGGDAFSPPATTLPQISTAEFDFINYNGAAGNAGDDIAFVVHLVDAAGNPVGIVNGFIPDQFLDGSSHDAATNWVFTAPAGTFIADIQFYSGANPDGSVQDLQPGKIDLVSVGVQSSDLDETITFNVTITDADGDPVSGSFTVNVTDDGSASTPEAALLPPDPQSFSTLSTESLLVSDSDDQQVQKTAANSNTLTLAAAVAAAGMAESAAASPPAADQSSDSSEAQAFTSQVVESLSADDGVDDLSAVSGLAETQEADEAAGNSGGHSQGDDHRSDASLDAASNQQSSDEGSELQAANDQGPAAASADAGPAAQSVAMVSAEALQAAGLVDNAQHGGAVETIIAEALGQGNGDGAVDALLDAIHGGNGDGPAIANLASAHGDAVSAWDTASNGGSAGNLEMLMKVGAEMLHHDMVQPTHNG